MENWKKNLKEKLEECAGKWTEYTYEWMRKYDREKSVLIEEVKEYAKGLETFVQQFKEYMNKYQKPLTKHKLKKYREGMQQFINYLNEHIGNYEKRFEKLKEGENMKLVKLYSDTLEAHEKLPKFIGAIAHLNPLDLSMADIEWDTVVSFGLDRFFSAIERIGSLNKESSE